MKPLFTVLCLLLLAGASYAQSQLPACQGGSPSRWSNCTGRWLKTRNTLTTYFAKGWKR